MAKKRANGNESRTERMKITIVEEILEFLPKDAYDEFMQYARFYRNAIDLQKWLVEAQSQYA